MRNPVENSKQAVNTLIKNSLDNAVLLSDNSCAMAIKKEPIPRLFLRANEEDYALVVKLRKKLGVDNSQILRIALRSLADKEGLRATA